MRVLITGGAGFIGCNLVRFLLNESEVEAITVLDDFSTGRAENLSSSEVELVTGSVLDADALDAALRGVTAIIHLAAIPSVPRSIKQPVASHQANATGTLNVLEAALRHDVEHIVVASSSSVYGSNPHLPKNELDWTRPLSPYAVSKLATEAYALAYQQCYGLPALAFRFFNVYGPAQTADHAYAAVVPKIVRAALLGQAAVVQGSGRQTRDFTYVETVCRVLYAASRGKLTDEQPVNLAFGSSVSLLELLALLEDLTGAPIDREFVAARVGDVPASQADGRRCRELFPDVDPVGLRTGLEATLDWYRSAASLHRELENPIPT